MLASILSSSHLNISQGLGSLPGDIAVDICWQCVGLTGPGGDLWGQGGADLSSEGLGPPRPRVPAPAAQRGDVAAGSAECARAGRGRGGRVLGRLEGGAEVQLAALLQHEAGGGVEARVAAVARHRQTRGPRSHVHCSMFTSEWISTDLSIPTNTKHQSPLSLAAGCNGLLAIMALMVTES